MQLSRIQKGMQIGQVNSAWLWGLSALLCGSLGAGVLAEECAVPESAEQPALALPAFESQYVVGVRSFAWIDDTRSQSGRPADAGQREITATIWYPSNESRGQKPAAYFPTLEKIIAAADDLPAEQQRYVLLHEPLLNVATNSVPCAAPARKSGAWPVLLFSPGGSVSSHAQTTLAERLAGNGYVVAAMSHPQSSFDFAPVTGFSMSREWDLDNEDRQIADRNDNELAGILAGDAKFVLDRLRDLKAGSDPLGQVLDLDRVGIAGHSRGGKTVGRACSSSDDFKACVVLDNIGPAKERTTGIEQPFLALRAPWGEERIAELHDYLGRTGSVAYDVELANSNHFSCSDLPLFISDIRAENMAPADGIKACAGLLQAFLDRYLVSGSARAGGWLPAYLTKQVAIRSFVDSEHGPGSP